MDRLLKMSNQEIKRLEVMQQLKDKRMKQGEAAEKLGMSTRQVKRLLKVYREEGAEGLISKRGFDLEATHLRHFLRFLFSVRWLG